jgi:hypothetical protein
MLSVLGVPQLRQRGCRDQDHTNHVRDCSTDHGVDRALSARSRYVQHDDEDRRRSALAKGMSLFSSRHAALEAYRG